MINKILCFFGFHSWLYMEPRIVPTGNEYHDIKWSRPRVCICCKTKRV